MQEDTHHVHKNIGITNFVARLGMTLGSIVSIKLLFFNLIDKAFN